MYSEPSIIRTPLVTADSSGVQIIEVVQINETTSLCCFSNGTTHAVPDSFPVVLRGWGTGKYVSFCCAVYFSLLSI